MVATTPRRLAVFDLDGTLLTVDSLGVFLRLVMRRVPRTWTRLPVVTARVLRALAARPRSHHLKQAVLGLIDGLSGAEQRMLVDAVVAHLLADCLRPDIAARIATHAAAGEEPILISASPDLYVGELGRRLGFETVLCTRLTDRPDGGKGSRLAGANCKGEEKVSVLLQALAGAPIDWAGSAAYSDHASDLPLLERVGTPVAVHPESRLRAEATRRGWEIVG